MRGRSYAPRGDTPVVRPCHEREKVGLMSAVTNRGVVRWNQDGKAGLFLVEPIPCEKLESALRF